jgi:hypothetical protein
MSFDLKLFSDKLNLYCERNLITINELSSSTQIPIDRLNQLTKGLKEPSGDEVLTLAAYFNCDYYFFISNEQKANFEQMNDFYRQYGEICRSDRRNIQEFLFLCENQDYLQKILQSKSVNPQFNFEPQDKINKQQGIDIANKLRKYFNYNKNQLPSNIYSDFRKIGFHIFRRKLGTSAISGIFINHDKINKCILINYSEDLYRQNFSLAHEVAHALLDGQKFNITKTDRSAKTS